MRSFIMPLLAFIRITVRGARWLFGCTVPLLLVTLQMYRDMTKAGEILALPDFAYIAAIGLFALLFAWLGFTDSGKALLAKGKSNQDEVAPLQLARLLKVLFASMGMAVGIWLVLIVLSLIIGGPDLVSVMFLPWVLILLTAICFPFAYRWLK